jgi:hypothetical protein
VYPSAILGHGLDDDELLLPELLLIPLERADVLVSRGVVVDVLLVEGVDVLAVGPVADVELGVVVVVLVWAVTVTVAGVVEATGVDSVTGVPLTVRRLLVPTVAVTTDALNAVVPAAPCRGGVGISTPAPLLHAPTTARPKNVATLARHGLRMPLR